MICKETQRTASKRNQVTSNKEGYAGWKDMTQEIIRASKSIPGLLDLESPLEGQVLLLVVVHELAESVVRAAEEHSRGGLLLSDY